MHPGDNNKNTQSVLSGADQHTPCPAKWEATPREGAPGREEGRIARARDWLEREKKGGPEGQRDGLTELTVGQRRSWRCRHMILN